MLDGYEVGRKTKMACASTRLCRPPFFALSGVLRVDRSHCALESHQKTYGKRGEAVVAQNFGAVDAALEHLFEGRCPTA